MILYGNPEQARDYEVSTPEVEFTDNGLIVARAQRVGVTGIPGLSLAVYELNHLGVCITPEGHPVPVSALRIGQRGGETLTHPLFRYVYGYPLRHAWDREKLIQDLDLRLHVIKQHPETWGDCKGDSVRYLTALREHVKTLDLHDGSRRLGYCLYGDMHHLITHAELLDEARAHDGDFWAHAEDSGCEGTYIEVARWQDGPGDTWGRWCRYCFLKVFGGELPTLACDPDSDLNGHGTALAMADEINAASGTRAAAIIHNFPKWESPKP